MNVDDRARLIAKATGYRLKHIRRMLKAIDPLSRRVKVRAVVEQFKIPKATAKRIVRMAQDDYKPTMKNLYVIRLGKSEDGKSVLDDRRFMERNPDYQPGKPCVYVGETAHDPEKRFRQHKCGDSEAPIANRYGRCLMKEEYEHLNPVPALLATEEEQALALRLQGKGYAVWWN